MLPHMDIYLILFWVGLAGIIIGLLIAAAGGISFQWRALRNKPAWDGHTRPLLVWGCIILVIGIIVFAPGLMHQYYSA